MPLSMRAKTLARNRRIKKINEEKDCRAKVLSLIKAVESALKASHKTGISRITVIRIRKLFDTSKTMSLKNCWIQYTITQAAK